MIDALSTGRRGFMFGAGAMLFAKPKLIVSRVPTIYGDGVNDDWEGIQSLMFGRPVRLVSGETFAPGRAPKLSGGKYIVSASIVMDERSSGAVIEDCSIRCASPGNVVEMRGVSGALLRNVNLSTPGLGGGFGTTVRFIRAPYAISGYGGQALAATSASPERAQGLE